MTDACFASDQGLIAADEALAALLDSAQPIAASETLPLAEALGRIVHDAVVSPIDVPGYDNSAMDGYAVRAAELEAADGTHPVHLPVSQRVAAGSQPGPLEMGSAARIFTGAPIPAGADSVVMQEVVHERDAVACFTLPAPVGDNIRPRGNDIAREAGIIEPGVRLGPGHLGLAASVGVAELSVFRRLRVAVFFTGDEIVAPGEPLRAGQIYNSNAWTLTGLLRQMGCEVIDLGRVADRFDDTLDALQKAAARADVVMTSGGMSVGEEDHVKAAVEQAGELDLWRIAIKPGKPFAHGRVGDAVFMGLPGNPVSVFVTFLWLARPVLLRMMGAREVLPTALPMRSGFAWPRAQPRRELLRVQIQADGHGGLHAVPFPRQGSDVLSSVVWAHGLAEIPEGQTIEPGDTVNYYALTDLLHG
ncbi:MAG: gephyrin-like molybdotransferase Glp [Gammaproteobacteria bacterium]